eukprot:comp23134_c0_seq5/m.37320 comp23134_c0_seq5/g.37320  ORF comp23134_c0_seq5/g.37320 comp23134_c0_seq5/m.37320 type:complete len:348 (-) comp23134_c0_seq5:160-1203(-)
MRGCLHMAFCGICKDKLLGKDTPATAPCCETEYSKCLGWFPSVLTALCAYAREFFDPDTPLETVPITERHALDMARLLEGACGHLSTNFCVCGASACSMCMLENNGKVPCGCPGVAGKGVVNVKSFTSTILSGAAECLQQFASVADIYGGRPKRETESVPTAPASKSREIVLECTTKHETVSWFVHDGLGPGTHTRMSNPDEFTVGKKPPEADLVNLFRKIVVEIKDWQEPGDGLFKADRYRDSLRKRYGITVGAVLVFFEGNTGGPVSESTRASVLNKATRDGIVVFEYLERCKKKCAHIQIGPSELNHPVAKTVKRLWAFLWCCGGWGYRLGDVDVFVFECNCLE